MDIDAILRKNRPQLSESSYKTYKSVLKSIYKKVYPSDKDIDIKKFENFHDFLDVLKDLEYNKRKTVLASLVVFTNNKEYHTLMMTDIHKYKDNEMKQEKTDTQKENWLSFDEVKNVLTAQETVATPLFAKKSLLMSDLQKIQNYVLLCLTSGIFIEPRRSIDWIMKWRNYDAEKDNYVDMKKNIFVFQSYKTAKTYHRVDIPLPKGLKLIMTKWFKINPTDYVLFDNNSNSISSPKITDRLNQIFGKKISTSMLRHIYVTHKFGDVDLKKIQETATNMGNSPLQLLQYVKR